MENAKAHTRGFLPRYYEMDRHGAVTPLTMLSLFEETGFSHCEESGWDVFRLRSEGFGWVLLNGSFRMYRYPRYKEPFTIETRLAAARAFYGLRDFVVRVSSGDIVGTARSLWTFYDVERRRPARIPGAILEAWRHDPSAPCAREDPPDDAPGPDCLDPLRAYDVRYSDIDTNGHVNNVNYLEWALEAVPAEVLDGYTLAAVDGWYLHQVRHGCRVKPAVREREPIVGGPRSFDLAVYDTGFAGSGEARLVSCARSAWLRRRDGS